MRTLPPLPTNHLQRQKLALEASEAQRKALEGAIRGLRDLVRSDKFRENPYINVVDVLTWADQALTAQNDAESAVYAVARMRHVLVGWSAVLDNIGAENVYELRATDIEGPRETTVYVQRDNLDMALDVLKADGFAFAELHVWEHDRFVYDRRVTL